MGDEYNMVEEGDKNKEDIGVKKLFDEFKVEEGEEVEGADTEEKEDEEVVEIEEISGEEKRGKGRPRLTEEEKKRRQEERKKIREELREKRRKERPPKTPYVGGTPKLEDSGGWCLEESKTVTTVVDRRTGVKKTTINGLEVARR